MERHGLSRPSATLAPHAIGRLSPMAFLVGVNLRRAQPVTPTPPRRIALPPQGEAPLAASRL